MRETHAACGVELEIILTTGPLVHTAPYIRSEAFPLNDPLDVRRWQKTQSQDFYRISIDRNQSDLQQDYTDSVVVSCAL